MTSTGAKLPAPSGGLAGAILVAVVTVCAGTSGMTSVVVELWAVTAQDVVSPSMVRLSMARLSRMGEIKAEIL